ncbi:MAG: lactonase family protein [Thermoguttaceae bacterium]
MSAQEESSGCQPEQRTQCPFYVGTYTQAPFQGQGIYRAELDLKTGELSQAELVVECDRPAFVIRHPRGPFLYSIGETWEHHGPVHSFAIQPGTNQLRLLNTRQINGVLGPTHLCLAGNSTVSGDSDVLVVACYGSGTTVSLPIEKDGTIGEVVSFMQHQGSGPKKDRQEGPHAHGVYVDAQQRVYVPDLGIDQVVLYDLDLKTGTLTPGSQRAIEMVPGSGPRHLAFGTDQGTSSVPTIYVVNELNSTVSVVRPNQDGVLGIVQNVSTLPQEVLDAEKKLDNWTAEIAVHPNGRFVYASNRGHDSIAVFSVDAESGQLKLVQTESTQGRTPRNFSMTPDGRFLLAANQDSNTVVSFWVDPESGRLTPTGSSVEVGSPVCVVF